MVNYERRPRNEEVKNIFKDSGDLNQSLLASRLIAVEADNFCSNEDPLIPFLKDKKLVESVGLLKKHIDAGSSILVITDGDADGISCASVANLFFKNELNMIPVVFKDENDKSDSTIYSTKPAPTATAIYEEKQLDKGNLFIVVNDRMYGNGVNIVHAKHILKLKPDLIITADHGSSDHKSFTLIKDVLPHTDILVTDHHIVPDDVIPTCDAFVNPQDKDSTLGKALCGAAVLYLLFRAYSNKPLEYLYPILGLATVVDQMSLNIDYNRYLYRQANKHVKNFLPFREYIRYVNHRYLWSTEFYSIGLGPLVNSTKRMNEPEVGYKFLTASTKEEVFKYYTMMTKTNKARKEQQAKVELSIEASVRKDRENFKYSRVAISEIKNGVNGILASRLVDNDHVPSFVFNVSGDTYEGSGRGHGNFNIEGLISSFRKNYSQGYISGGGHKGAGGVRLRKAAMPHFRNLFERLGSKTETEVVEYYDMELPLSMMKDNKFRKELRKLQPYGRGFAYPVFKVKATIKGYKNYGPSFFIYTVYDHKGYEHNMMRFAELPNVKYNDLVTLYISPRGKKDYILLDVEKEVV